MAELLGVLGCGAAVPIQWEHGWKTERVIATRYKNESMGYNIGFAYPKNINDADRAEVGEFMESHIGWVYQGGGYPGAVMYVKFKDVTDKATADKKLREILPSLDRLMRDISNGVAIKKPPPRKIIDKLGKEWPECIPPDPNDPFGEINNNMSVNGVPYKCSALGKWEIDAVAMEWKHQEAQKKRALYWALRTRVLTDEEMKTVEGLGLYLVTEEMVSFNEADKRRELNDALLQQARLRQLTHGPATTAAPNSPADTGDGNTFIIDGRLKP